MEAARRERIVGFRLAAAHGACADDIAVLRGCWTNGINHSGGVCQMNTGVFTAGRPSLGALVSYGLGTENQNLPSFVVIPDKPSDPVNGPRNWGSGFMPAAYQGTRLKSGTEPIANLKTPKGITPKRQRAKLEFLTELNREHAKRDLNRVNWKPASPATNFAFRMQATAPEAVELSQETDETQKLYGIESGANTSTFGRNCLLARRLVERGVRFVQLYHGTGQQVGRSLGHRKKSHNQLRRERQTRRRPVERSQASRTAGFNAGRVGR